MVTSPGDRAKVASDLRELDTTVAAVRDVASFQQFILTDNLITSETQKSDLAGLVDADHAANHFGMLYLILYAMGSITALLGQALD